MFPHGSAININVTGIENQKEGWHSFPLLTSLVRDCSIAHTIRIEARKTAFLSRWNSTNEWGNFAALRHLRFTRCDDLTEWELRALVTNLMIGSELEMGLLLPSAVAGNHRLSRNFRRMLARAQQRSWAEIELETVENGPISSKFTNTVGK